MERAGDVWFVMRMGCLDGMDKLRLTANTACGNDPCRKAVLLAEVTCISAVIAGTGDGQMGDVGAIRGVSGRSSSLHPHVEIVWCVLIGLPVPTMPAPPDGGDAGGRQFFVTFIKAFGSFRMSK
jgi:hypothetical protein